jgi:2-polyprenyl-6-methoxyphenol hydroxylase-like FAD-dependent oxidoreductase
VAALLDDVGSELSLSIDDSVIETYEEEADGLIGADGVKSAMRQACLPHIKNEGIIVSQGTCTVSQWLQI